MENFNQEHHIKNLFKEVASSQNLRPSTDFKERTRHKLLNLYVLHFEEQKASIPVFSLRPLYARVFAFGAFLILFFTLGILHSLPGDFLYPVKLAGESFVLSVVNDTTKKQLNAHLLEKRQEEIKKVSEKKSHKGETKGKVIEKKEKKVAASAEASASQGEEVEKGETAPKQKPKIQEQKKQDVTKPKDNRSNKGDKKNDAKNENKGNNGKKGGDKR